MRDTIVSEFASVDVGKLKIIFAPAPQSLGTAVNVFRVPGVGFFLCSEAKLIPKTFRISKHRKIIL